MIIFRFLGNTLESRVLRYIYRNRKRSVDLPEVANTFQANRQELLLMLHGLQEDKLLVGVDPESDSYRFEIADKVKDQLNLIRNGIIVLLVVCILALYTIIRNLVISNL
jgi:hypothetical protein